MSALSHRQTHVAQNDMSALTPKRTCATQILMSAMGQQRTHAPQQQNLYSITSSAATSNVCGTLRPSVLAVLRLMTNSNLVDCMTGRSAGFVPLRMRPA